MTYEYAFAAGHNVDEMDLDAIEEIRISGKPLMTLVTGLGDFTEGLERQYIDTIEDVGFAAWTWVSKGMKPAELAYLMTTYLAGKRSGKVTVRTRKNNDVWANFNATLTFPQKLSLDETGDFYRDVEWQFILGSELA